MVVSVVQIIYILTHFCPLILSTTDWGVLKYVTMDVCVLPQIILKLLRIQNRSCVFPFELLFYLYVTPSSLLIIFLVLDPPAWNECSCSRFYFFIYLFLVIHLKWLLIGLNILCLDLVCSFCYHLFLYFSICSICCIFIFFHFVCFLCF